MGLNGTYENLEDVIVNRERNYILDFIRIIAAFSVVSVHFFLNNGFYNEVVTGTDMYIAITMKNFFMICVPLFLLLTGYLKGNKRDIDKKYYHGIFKILAIYILSSIACIIYKKSAGIIPYDFKHACLAILNFSGADYSWYIEMYIGLFLLIPFLNIIFLNIDKNQKRILIITLLFMTSVPTFTNIYNFDIENWWLNPSSNAGYQKILPFFWVTLWPITYYYIGNYLREHPLKLNRKATSLLIAVTSIASGTFNFYRSYNTIYVRGIWQDWNGVLNIILSTLMFHFLLQMNWINKIPATLKHSLRLLSDLTLGAYLVSYIFDQIFYKVLVTRVPKMTDRLKYYIIIVPLIFVCSMLLSYILNMIYYIAQLIIQRLKIRKNRS